MWSISLRMTKKKAACLTAVLLLGALTAFFMGKSRPAAAAGVQDVPVHKEEERTAYLRSLGWEVSSEPIEVREVLIPREFDAVMENYNRIQKEQGMDLFPIRGRTVRRYTYAVHNYPGQPEHVRADLFLYKGKIVAADLCSTRLDGFLHGLCPKASLPQSEDHRIGTKTITAHRQAHRQPEAVHPQPDQRPDPAGKSDLQRRTCAQK